MCRRRVPFRLFLPLLAVCFLAAGAGSAPGQSLLLCGMEEVFEVKAGPAADAGGAGGGGGEEKIWSWRAAGCAEIPENFRRAFATTAECKPVTGPEGQPRVLITSSAGGCALVEYPAGRAVWTARVTNAHSAELLPGNLVVVAGSVGKEGDRLALFDLTAPSGPPLSWTPLPSAHGVVWDAARSRLWALGYDELRSYRLAGRDTPGGPELRLERAFRWQGRDGHDLQPVPGGDDLLLTDEAGAWLFDRKTFAFRPHPELAAVPEVKSAGVLPGTGRVVYTGAGGGEWWTREIRFLNPEGTRVFPGERIYKVRWRP